MIRHPTKRYPSKRDTWLVIGLLAGVVAMAVAVGAVWQHAESAWTFRATMTGISLFAGAFMLWVLFGTEYTLRSDGVLVIQSGPFRWKVLLDDIDEIVPTPNPLSSPATSLDRIKIRYRTRTIMISPEEKQAFMRDVASRDPELEYQRDRVVRRVP